MSDKASYAQQVRSAERMQRTDRCLVMFVATCNYRGKGRNNRLVMVNHEHITQVLSEPSAGVAITNGSQALQIIGR